MRMNREKQKSPGESRREESNKQLFFVPPTADFLNGQRPIFFTVAAAVVMHRMTVGMVETARRKTHFPAVVATNHTKAKPTATATAFYVYVNPL